MLTHPTVSFYRWYREIRRSYNKYVTETLVKVQALRSGVEPMYKKTSCWSCMTLPDVMEPQPVPNETNKTNDGVSTIGTVISEDQVY